MDDKNKNTTQKSEKSEKNVIIHDEKSASPYQNNPRPKPSLPNKK